ncbi:MAG TPA: RpiB/LacA/LacB family sugar-phosphate isomerase [Pyrinomonadaceae bacterium]|nr:RpiB/LacA/LacB family sugar-phosphate isomerase [Pyrinomonadaceae bacterium]
MPEGDSTRDRVRALVREVLKNAAPAEGSDAPDANEGSRAAESAQSPRVDAPARARVVDVAPSSEPPAQPARDYTHDESSKTVITEDDVRALPEGARLRVAESARLTPLAADIVRERRIELVRRAPRRGTRAEKIVAVGADHGGYPLKEELKKLLAELGHRVRDFGTNSTDAVDYPDFAHAVARSVSEGEADLGVVIDGAGVGSCMTANKVPGVRAAACYSVKVAVNSREHNDANVLTLGSGTINTREMRDIVTAWLSTEITEDRHKRRVAKIEAVERQYRC